VDRELQPRRAARWSSWLKESTVGADEHAPYRPGRYLETPLMMSGNSFTLSLWIVPFLGGLAPIVTMGLLERYIRKQLRR
jgi:hypothetical protein